MKNLVIDQGNTKVKYGIFTKNKMERMVSRNSLSCDNILELVTNHQLKNIIYSSVATTLTQDDKDRLQEKTHFVELTHHLQLPIKNAYATPATLGLDRLAAVVGAYALYPKQACLVIDAGTCMTMEVLDEQGEYLGGNISPGIHMRLNAMHHFTARLPLVDIERWDENWGISTSTALQNGGLLGACLEIEGLQQRLQKKWPSLKCLLTGGDAQLLATRLENNFLVHNNLVLVGLNKILTDNVEQLA